MTSHSYRYIRARGVRSSLCGAVVQQPPYSKSLEYSSDEEKGFVASVIPNVRSLPPGLRALLQKRSSPRSSSAVRRQRPRLWEQATSVEASPFETQASNTLKRTRHGDCWDSDDEEDSSSDEDDERILFARRPLKRVRRNRAPRNSLSSPSPRRTTLVSFARPLVTATWTRPRTESKEKGALFYTKAETKKFRREYHREQRLRLTRREWESDSTSLSREEEEEVEVLRPNPRTAEDVAASSRCRALSEDVHEVTESSSSNDEESSDEEE